MVTVCAHVLAGYGSSHVLGSGNNPRDLVSLLVAAVPLRILACSSITEEGWHSRVAATRDIARLDGRSCSSGELGASSSGELGGDIGCLVKNCNFDGVMEIMVEGQNLMEIPTEDLCFL